jgi:hypothetical protein
MYTAAGCQLVIVVVTLSQLGTVNDAYQRAFAGSSMTGAPAMLVAITAATAVGIGLLLAVGYGVLGVLDSRGRRAARIVTWVFGGVSACCTGSNLLWDAVGLNRLGGSHGTNAPSAGQVQDALDAALPGWYHPVLAWIGIADIVALVVAVVLLALPPANDFFRGPARPVRAECGPGAPADRLTA